jgi:hypothetical protein
MSPDPKREPTAKEPTRFRKIRRTAGFPAILPKKGVVSLGCDLVTNRFAIVATTILLSGTAMAQQDQRLPPENAIKLSEIVAKVEQREGFRFVDEIEWDQTGYTVVYYTTDKAKVEIVFDPVTGQPK